MENCILGDGCVEVVNGSWSFWEEIGMVRNYTWVRMFVFYVDGELVPGFGVLGLLVVSWIEEVADRVFKLLHFGARGTAAAYSRKYVEGFFFELDASTFVVVHSLVIFLACVCLPSSRSLR